MKLSFWLESLYSRSGRRSLRRHRERHRNQPLSAWVELFAIESLEDRTMLSGVVFEDNFDSHTLGEPPAGWTEMYNAPPGTPVYTLQRPRLWE